MLPGVGSSSSPCPAFVGTTPTAAGFLNCLVPSCPTGSYANPALLLQRQPADHRRCSVERHRLNDPIPTTTAASARLRVLQSILPSSPTDGSASLQKGQGDANTEDIEDDGAERMFATARALHLRRHRSPASRDLALKLFRETLRRRPAWKETDSRFAVESGIDEVFESFSCQDDLPYCPNGTPRTKTGDKVDVRCLRVTLARVGYTARTVQERFGVAGGQRLPGPYYLRKSFDHKNVSYSMLLLCSRLFAVLFFLRCLRMLGLLHVRTYAQTTQILRASDRKKFHFPLSKYLSHTSVPFRLMICVLQGVLSNSSFGGDCCM